jgi:hypothetical protein
MDDQRYSREEMLAKFAPIELDAVTRLNEGMAELNCMTTSQQPEAEIQPTLDWTAIFESIKEYKKY